MTAPFLKKGIGFCSLAIQNSKAFPTACSQPWSESAGSFLICRHKSCNTQVSTGHQKFLFQFSLFPKILTFLILTVALHHVCASGNQVIQWVQAVASMKVNMVQNGGNLPLLRAPNHRANCNSQVLKMLLWQKSPDKPTASP